MHPIERIRQWWQVQTGEDDTPLDGDTPAWGASFLFHTVLLLVVALLPIVPGDSQVTLTLTAPLEEEEFDELEIHEDFAVDLQLDDQIGADSFDGVEAAMSLAPELSEITAVENPRTESFELGNFDVQRDIEIATGENFSKNFAVRGTGVVGTTGAEGAIDRITHEILLSLEERKTLAVWLFDQSGSLAQQRSTVRDRFDRVYEELGIIEATGNQAFSKHDDRPLLTSIVAFGQNVSFLTPKPTDSLAEIKEAVTNIALDDSGTELAFSAVYAAAEKYQAFRVPDPETGEPTRNVMLIVFTDEAGDDYRKGLPEALRICRRNQIPVLVVGVPAPFGRLETHMKWVDPDPRYDQTPQWGRVNQGPESLAPERLNLQFTGWDEQKSPIDSGFGPFALTRLAFETGGVYLAVHPNRDVHRQIGRNETAAFSAHLEQFFDSRVMRKYRPDYVSRDEYVRKLRARPNRAALVTAAQMSWKGKPIDHPKVKFIKRDAAGLAKQVAEAQQLGARILLPVQTLYAQLQVGEAARANEISPRWRAGFDLAMGRILAAKVRTEAYNAMLAQIAAGKPFANPRNNTWQLEPSDVVTVGTDLSDQAARARTYLQQVIDEHPNTPWAYVATRELAEPVAWVWQESYTDLNPDRGVGRGVGRGGGGGGGGGRGVGIGGGNNNAPRPKPKPKRPLPKL